MAGRPRNRNHIRGPHSALTDFLADNNISAAEILDRHRRRVADAQDETIQQEAEQTAEQNATGSNQEEEPSEDEEQAKSRKRKREMAINRIKNSKAFARRKARQHRSSDSELDDELANIMADEIKAPVPGQLENCDICGKRFTVTAYSKEGPNGGLLCPDCSKKAKDGDKKKPAKKSSGLGRRANQSNLLDGLVPGGACSLLEMCINAIAINIEDVEEFGDIPPRLMHRLSHILSRRRAITPKTLDLFLRRDHKELNIYDCAQLDTDDYHKIFALMPDLTRLNLRFVSPMKDCVFEYMIDRRVKLEHLHLDSPNLVTDVGWRKLFVELGPQLQSLKLWNLNAAFDDETTTVMSQNCTALRRLTLKYLWRIGDESLSAISNMKNLEHLSLHLMAETQRETLLKVITNLGPKLQTLSLKEFVLADDTVLESIHTHCRKLSKLRITNNDICTDKGMAALFSDWDNEPLKFADFSCLRHVDMSDPAGPAEPVGLASDGLIALMAHSGSHLESIYLSSCRHISRAAFEEVFCQEKQYPKLKSIDLSFNELVDNGIINGILKCCPVLKTLVVFGCFKVRDVSVPRDVALIGTIVLGDE